MTDKKEKLHKRQWDAKEGQEEEEEDSDVSEDQEIESNDDIEGDSQDDEDVEVGEGEDDDDEDESIDDDEESNEDDELECDSEDLIDITQLKKKKKSKSQKGGNQEEDEEDDDDEDDEEEDDADDESGSDISVLNVEMEFKDASENMFHSVKGLVNNYLESDGYVSSDLADTIVKQAQLGTFIVIDEEEDENTKKIREKQKLEREINTIGFCTILGSSQPALKETLRFAKEKSEKHASQKDHQKLLSVFSNPAKLGLLINERIINVSPQAVPVLHQQVLEDYKWVKQERNADFKAKFDFDFLLCIAKCVKEPTGPVSKKDPQLGHKKFKKNQEDEEIEDLSDYLYPKFEDFLLLEKAVAKFIYEAPRNSKSIDDIKMKQITYKAVFIIRFCDYLKAVPEFAHQLIE